MHLFESRIPDICTFGQVKRIWKLGYNEGAWTPSNGWDGNRHGNLLLPRHIRIPLNERLQTCYRRD